MIPGEDEFDLRTETTEQALARVEAECGWSDLRRFADAFAPTQGASCANGERDEG
jgi:hypothetical protein